nr:Rv3654c family TadE-like protein [Kineosphaera limosa]
MSTVLSLGIILVTIALMFAGLLIAGAVLATHRARGAADLAALAAATRLLRGSDEAAVCRVARQVAADNGARMTRCRAAGAGAAVSLPVATGGARDRPASESGGGTGRSLGSPGSVEVETAVDVPPPLDTFGPARGHAIAGSK